MVRHENRPGRSYLAPVPFKKREQRLPKNNSAHLNPPAPSGPSRSDPPRHVNNIQHRHRHQPQYRPSHNNNQGQSSFNAGVNTFQPADNITRVQPPKNWIVSIAKHTVRNIKNQRILARLNGIFGPPPANPNNLQANNTIVLPFQNRVEGELQGYDEPKQAPRTDTPISASIPNEAIKASSSAVPGPSSTSHRNVGSDHNQLYPDAHQEGYGNLPPELFDAWNGPVTDDTFLEHNQMHGQKPSKKLIRFDPAIGQRYLENIPGPTVTLRNLFEEANPSPTTMYQEWESDRHWLLRKLDREPRQPAMLQH